MECKHVSCSNEAQGKSAFCSKSCRAQHSRRNKSSATSEAQQVAKFMAKMDSDAVVIIADEVTARGNGSEFNISGTDSSGLKDTDIVIDDCHHATRTNPDTLNTGKHMTAHQLKQAGLKANRVPIPGDHDYKGVCEQVDGVWKVRAA